MRVSIVFTALVLFSFVFVACGNEKAADSTTETSVSSTSKVDAVTGYIDPACQMKVAEDASITHTHEGVTYGFCGEGCKTAFVADPDAFLMALEE